MGHYPPVDSNPQDHFSSSNLRSILVKYIRTGLGKVLRLFPEIIIVTTTSSELIFLKQCYHISVDGLIIIIKYLLYAFSRKILLFHFYISQMSRQTKRN